MGNIEGNVSGTTERILMRLYLIAAVAILLCSFAAAAPSMDFVTLELNGSVLSAGIQGTESTGADLIYQCDIIIDGVNVTEHQFDNGTYISYQEYADSHDNISGADSLTDYMLLFDGNYLTRAYDGPIAAPSNVIINYSRPLFLNSAKWQVKDNAKVNLTIPDDCISAYNNLYLRARHYTTDSSARWYCYNSTGFPQELRIVPTGANYLYEEAIFWNLSSGLTEGIQHNEAIEPIGDGVYYLSCRASNGTAWTAWENSSSVSLPNVMVTIYDEMTQNPMDISGIEQVRLDVFCPSKTERFNITQTHQVMNFSCSPDYLKLWFLYNSSAQYFRSVIPQYTGVYNFSFYMIDLNKNIRVQWSTQVVDLSSEYSQTPFIVSKNTQTNGTIEIFSQPTDIQNKVVLHLIQDETYIISVKNSRGGLRVVGNIVADANDEKLISLPSITFTPENTYLAEDITWGHYFNVTEGVLRVVYDDASNMTESITVTIRNATDNSIISTYTTTTAQNLSYSIAVYPNESYTMALEFCHGVIGCQYERKTFGYKGFDPNLDFFYTDPADVQKFKAFVAAGIMILTIGLFPLEFVAVGAIAVIIELFVFSAIGWMFWTPALAIGLFGVFLGFIVVRLVVRAR